MCLYRSTLRQWLVVGLTGVWAVAVLGMITALAALHDIPIAAAAGPVRNAPESARWRLVHVLAEDCPCSGVVADALARRRALTDADETIVFTRVDQTQPANTSDNRFAAAAFDVRYQAADQLIEGVAVQGAPWLMVIAPDGRIVYSGGYALSRPRPGTALQDRIILDRLRQGETVPPLPAFGCMTDRQQQQAIDPLGLKY